MAKEWQIKPAMHRMIVQLIPREDEIYGEQSKIIVPGSAEMDSTSKLYRVVAVGEGEISIRYLTGDIVFLASYSGGMIRHRKEELFSIGEGEVLAKLITSDLELPRN